jgi:hypothetical protein
MSVFSFSSSVLAVLADSLLSVRWCRSHGSDLVFSCDLPLAYWSSCAECMSLYRSSRITKFTKTIADSYSPPPSLTWVPLIILMYVGGFLNVIAIYQVQQTP